MNVIPTAVGLVTVTTLGQAVVTATDLAPDDRATPGTTVRWVRADLNEPLPPPARSLDSSLTATNAQRVLAEAGVKEVRMGYADRGRIPKIATIWRQASFGALFGRRFSDNVVVVARAPRG